MAEYIPGVCNIGAEEVKKRRQMGIVGLLITLILFILFIMLDAKPVWRLLIFFPAFSAATGFLQARMHFCSGYGLRGIYNVGKHVGNTETVEQAGFIKKDKQKALQILYLSVFIGIIVAIASYLV